MNYGKTTIQNVPVYNMGSNNYSNDMQLLVFNPKDITVEEVMKLENVFLSPLAKPNSLEIFAVYGTEAQYAQHKIAQFQAHVSREAVAMVGGIPANDDREKWDKLHELEEYLLAEIKCWYE
jgi:hypothetical protein